MKWHYRCVMWAGVGGLLGLAAQAHGQDPGMVASAADPTGVQTLIDLVSGGGLPAVLAVLGWLAGRWGGIPVAPVRVTLELAPEDRAELRRLRKAIEREACDDSEEPPAPRAA